MKLQIKRKDKPSVVDRKLWKKLNKFAKQIGLKVVYGVMLLYYSLQDDNVPVWAKTIIGSALAYFIVPLDLLPDIVPLSGYSDDLSVILLALSQVALFITPDTKARAMDRVALWFDLTDDEEIRKVVEVEEVQKQKGN